jgi:hypothetical protein
MAVEPAFLLARLDATTMALMEALPGLEGGSPEAGPATRYGDPMKALLSLARLLDEQQAAHILGF